MKKYFLLTALLCFIFGKQILLAQNYLFNNAIPVIQYGNTLKYPFAGGLNNPQFSQIDINQDGLKDIYIFDRTGNKSLLLINTGIENEIDYFYWHQYAQIFPDLFDWVVLIDYNCDGLEDIITGFDTGIKTYLASYDGASVSFTEDISKLQFAEAGFFFDLAVGYIDIPGFADINGDGDIDVLSFNISGGIVNYFENMQIEDGLDCGVLALEHVNSCWGDFYESGLTYSVELDYVCKGVTRTSDGVHAGSTFMIFDEDADGDMDIVLGDLAFNNLNRLINGGDKDYAHITEQDTTYPSYNLPYDVSIFPAPFLLDVNNDGKKDMLVSPNNMNLSENLKNVWHYENVSDDETYQFEYKSDSLFVSEMIDLGEGAYPIFFDHNYDGLDDLLIGNSGYFVAGNNIGQIALFENTGTNTAPVYTLISRDYMSLSQYNFTGLIPTMGDLDGDGDLDLLLGESEGFLHFFKNIADTDGPAEFILFGPNYQSIYSGANAAPQLIDVNEDGLPDLILGERNGNLNYYENTGTAAIPIFTLQNEFWGNVDVRTIGFLTGHSVPFLTKNSDEEFELYVGCESGTIYLYEPTPDFTGAFTKITSEFNGIDEGSYSSVYLKDITNDGFRELVTGNQRGGISMYRDENAVAINNSLNVTETFLIYPNPADQILTIEAVSNTKFSSILIYSIEGKLIKNNLISNLTNKYQFDIGELTPGIYFIEVRNLDHQLLYNGKFIKVE